MSFHAHFLYTDGMREYFVQIVPDVPEILSFAQKEVKIKLRAVNNSKRINVANTNVKSTKESLFVLKNNISILR